MAARHDMSGYRAARSVSGTGPITDRQSWCVILLLYLLPIGTKQSKRASMIKIPHGTKMSEEADKPVRGRPRKVSAADIRDTAMQAYWQRDPEDVSMNTICQLAGVSKPSVYRAFGSEDGLTLAVLETYAERVLSDIFNILNGDAGLALTLCSLIDFASSDRRMETGCLFHKMRAVKHRLGPMTRAKVDEIEAAASQACFDFLQASRDSGEWSGSLSLEDGARYLTAQLSLAFTQRSAGEDEKFIRKSLTLALSVFDGPIRRDLR